MKNLMLFVLVVFLAVNTVSAVEKSATKEIVGEWKYEVPSAPYGYNMGTLVIEEKEGKLLGHTKLEDGYKIDLKEVTYNDGIFKCGLYVDYNYVSIKAEVKGKNMKGMVDTPDGEMPITASKVK
ncbi:hypothetical protein [uncultured Draconibacterium sp.]|uniref:hypothetical protein n=1 Tax=uncultured Draconibacterium sp. TaxID=1573823 RepID=UPI0032603BD0